MKTAILSRLLPSVMLAAALAACDRTPPVVDLPTPVRVAAVQPGPVSARAWPRSSRVPPSFPCSRFRGWRAATPVLWSALHRRPSATAPATTLRVPAASDDCRTKTRGAALRI